MFSPCSPGIVNITSDVCKKDVKQHAHVLGTPDTPAGEEERRGEERRKGGVAENKQNLTQGVRKNSPSLALLVSERSEKI